MFIALLGATTAAHAGLQFKVNTTFDGVDDYPGDGLCHTAGGYCTLRAAIMEANHLNASATIVLPASALPYRLQISPSAADGEEDGDLNLTVPVGYVPGATEITGDGADVTVIDANGIDRVLTVDGEGRQVSISGVSIINGVTFSYGGGVAVTNAAAYLVLSDCIVRNNTALDVGGGIYTVGSLAATRVKVIGNNAGGNGGGIAGFVLLAPFSLTDSVISVNSTLSRGGGISLGSAVVSVDSTTIEGNTATIDGGGIFLEEAGQLNLSNSTLSGNTAGQNGGGIATTSRGTLVINRSTISGNAAIENGGGIFNATSLLAGNSTISGNSVQNSGGGITNTGTANLYNMTIAFNQADSDADGSGIGAGIFNLFSTLNLRNSVVAGNNLAGQQTFNDCSGSVGIYGSNRFSDTSGCAMLGSGSFLPVKSLDEIGILKDNGGPTRTHALVPPSNLINGATSCVDQNGALMTIDQRGRARSVGASCDIGAFEYDPGDIFASGFQ